MIHNVESRCLLWLNMDHTFLLFKAFPKPRKIFDPMCPMKNCTLINCLWTFIEESTKAIFLKKENPTPICYFYQYDYLQQCTPIISPAINILSWVTWIQTRMIDWAWQLHDEKQVPATSNFVLFSGFETMLFRAYFYISWHGTRLRLSCHLILSDIHYHVPSSSSFSSSSTLFKRCLW